MLRCECGALFNFPDHRIEPHPEVPFGNEWIACCPECGSDEIEDVYECQYCGEWTAYSECCDKCFEKLEQNITLAMRGWSKDIICMAWRESVDMNHLLEEIYYEEAK